MIQISGFPSAISVHVQGRGVEELNRSLLAIQVKYSSTHESVYRRPVAHKSTAWRANELRMCSLCESFCSRYQLIGAGGWSHRSKALRTMYFARQLSCPSIDNQNDRRTATAVSIDVRQILSGAGRMTSYPSLTTTTPQSLTSWPYTGARRARYWVINISQCIPASRVKHVLRRNISVNHQCYVWEALCLPLFRTHS